MRFHLFPFRTEKLSSLTPMVLRFSRGRVGSRLFKPILFRVGFFVFDSQPYKDISSIGRGVGLKRRLCRNSGVTYLPNPLSVKGGLEFVQANRFAPFLFVYSGVSFDKIYSKDEG